MWVFDGEQWTKDEGAVDSTPKPEMTRPRWDELMPELQVIEIVHVPHPKNTDLPPLPMP